MTVSLINLAVPVSSLCLLASPMYLNHLLQLLPSARKSHYTSCLAIEIQFFIKQIRNMSSLSVRISYNIYPFFYK